MSKITNDPVQHRMLL